jgi:hypothetical protein
MKYILIIYWASTLSITPFATVQECFAARDAVIIELYQEGSPSAPKMHCVEFKRRMP